VRFLNRVYRLVERHAQAVRGVKSGNPTPPRFLRKKISSAQSSSEPFARASDFETRWHFNSAIALIMEMTNEIYLQEPLEKEVRRKFEKKFGTADAHAGPMTPHLAEELWEMLGHAGGLWTASWPAFNEALTREDEVEIPVQVNGRLRGKLKSRLASGRRSRENGASRSGDCASPRRKSIVKRIFVPNKLLNLVVA